MNIETKVAELMALIDDALSEAAIDIYGRSSREMLIDPTYEKIAPAITAALEEARKVPEGWVAVPVEPTFEMKIAASNTWKPAADGHYTARMDCGAEVWASMLAARPEVPHD